MKYIFESLPKMYILSKGERFNIFILFILLFLTPILEAFGISMLAPLSALAVGEELNNFDLIDKINNIFPLESLNFNSIATIFLVVVLLRINLNILLIYIRSKIAVNFRYKWTETMIKTAMYSTYSSLSRERIGSILETISSETRKASNGFIILVQMIERVILASLLFIGLSITNLYLTSILIFIFGIVLLVLKFGGLFNSYRSGKKLQKYSQLILINSAELLSNIRQIKLLNIYDDSLKSVTRSLTKYSRERVFYDISNQLPRVFLESTLTIISVVGLIVVYNNSDKSLLNSLPNITLLIVLGGRLANVLSSITKGYIDLNVGLANIDSVFGRVTPENKLEDINIGNSINRITNEIKIKNLSYSWPNASSKTFKSLNLNFKKGLNLVKGPSGIGKSTLSNFILGLIEPDSGSIYFDEVDIKKYSLKTIRSCIAYVTQEDELFFGTIAENINLGSEKTSRKSIIKAAKLAKAHDFIIKLPQQYDTLISNKGETLSGGQRQRLSLARALLNPKSVYIFDEVTNSLDKENEKLVQETINKIAKNSIVIQISHLDSRNIDAERIFEFDSNGNIK